MIVFIDESGLSERPTRVRTWAPKGQTPIIQFHFNWTHISVIAGLFPCTVSSATPPCRAHGHLPLMASSRPMVEGYDDCEGDVLHRVRAIVGPNVAVGAELDLHCHFTETMRASADAIVALKAYPHVDGAERARELYRIVVDIAERRVRPTTAVFDCRMVGTWHTSTEPMASFVRRMQSFEGRAACSRCRWATASRGATWPTVAPACGS